MPLHATLDSITQRIIRRSTAYRAAYLMRINAAKIRGVHRSALACTNLAHGFAAFPANDKLRLREQKAPSLAIVSAYNDMLSAHQPFERFPKIIKDAAREIGAVAQFAGGVPAMCDGVTQGQPGMELSLFSRDTIALSTAIALSHNMFDAAVFLGVCDKIVPGLVIGALHFGHLPAVMIPAGPMHTGIPNAEKARVRQMYARGEVGRDALLESESASYHSAGTCTFYGTANSNQMMMEVMGLHLPGAAFIAPDDPLRDALTRAAAQRAIANASQNGTFIPIGEIVDERSIVNAIVILLATGGSTNHTMHLVAMARAAGIVIDWNDFDALSSVIPSLTRIYPNGEADVNHFQAAGGPGFVMRELLDAGLLHEDVQTVMGRGLRQYCNEPYFEGEKLAWRPIGAVSADDNVLRTVSNPFAPDGGLRLLEGNLGRAVIKVSAVKPQHRIVQAPARVFHSQEALMEAYQAGELQQDFVAVLSFQGPRANGMPELHALTPALSNLQDTGFHVALVTDGRMSGASGKVPAAIHLSPEALAGGALALVRDGDVIRLDAEAGTLDAVVPEQEWAQRKPAEADLSASHTGMGRELFGVFRAHVSTAEEGAANFELPPPLNQPDEFDNPLAVPQEQAYSDEDHLINSPLKGQDRDPA